MNDYYEVHIRLDDLVWDITGDGAEDADLEDVRVLDSLSIDWAMPAGLWAQQPDPMRCAFGLYVPDFQSSGVEELTEGSRVVVEVKVHPDAVPVAAFYGRVTDLQATPAPGRPGVMLSVAAIDYTVDLYELPLWVTVAYLLPTETTTVLAGLWSARALGTFPDWGAMADPDITVSDVVDPAPFIAQVLRQTVETYSGGIGPARFVISPLIDPVTGFQEVSQPWAFDLLPKDPQDWDDFTADACYIHLDSISWAYDKAGSVTRVQATGYGGDPENIATAEYASLDRYVTESFEVCLWNSTDPDAAAAFYLPPPDTIRWRLDTFRYRIGLLPEADLETFSALFPRWFLAEGEDFRGACYGLPVTVTDVPEHRSPIPGDSFYGRLAGAALSISGGKVAIDMQLRQVGEVP